MIFRYQGTQKIMLIIGIVFTLVGVPITALFGLATMGDVLISTSGKKTTGAVSDWRTMSNVKVNGRHPTEISFTYDVDGQKRSGTCATLDDELIEGLRQNGRVDVEYAGSFARIAGTTFSTVGFVGLIGFIFPLAGVLMAFFAIRSNRREIAAFTHGTLVHGTIASSGFDYSAQMNGSHPYKIVWEFSVDTDVYTGSLSSMEPSELNEYVVGRQVGVLYLAENPKVNTLYID